MATQVMPVYVVLAAALVLLVVALTYASMRLLSRRQVQCPGDGKQAEILVEFRRSGPWAKGGSERVLQCSHLPGAVTCQQACVNCNKPE